MKSFAFSLDEYRKKNSVVLIWLEGGFNVRGKIESMGSEFIRVEKGQGEFFLIPIDKICMIKVD